MSVGAAPPVRFMVRLPQTHCFGNPDGMSRVAEAAEELGFWGISVQDHPITDAAVSYCRDNHVAGGEDRIVFEALQTLAFVGARTDTVRLVTGVLITPLRNAILLAKEIASLDVFSSGRLIVGVGVGAPVKAVLSDEGAQNLSAHARIARTEFEAIGMVGHRGRIADESLEVMEAIWADDAATFHGTYYDFTDLAVYPKPAQRPRPPLWVGGRSDAARRRVMTRADAWFPSQISSEMYADGVAWMRAFAVANDVDMPVDFGVNLFAAIDADGDRARAANKATFGRRFTPDWLSKVTLGGDPDEVIAQIRSYVGAGVNVVDLKLVPPTLSETLEQMRLVASDVMPAFAHGARSR